MDVHAIIEIADKFGPGVLVPIACFAFVGIMAQWSLYDKCGLPGIDCVIPVKNVITFLKIVGRPASHGLYIMVPPPLILVALFTLESTTLKFAVSLALFVAWAYVMIKVYIELCQSFGRYKLTDYLMVILFNGFYVLYLGLSYEEKYIGPVYGKKLEDIKAENQLEGQLA